MNRLRELGSLRKAIIEQMCVKQWRDVWFFPERDGVKGWCGIAPIMFVGLNPSTGIFPPKADDFLLYRALRENGLADAHITDLVKVRMNGKAVQDSFKDHKLLRLHRGWLLDEVRLLEPVLIVGLGRKTVTYLKEWLPSPFNSRVEWVHHYAWAERYGRDNVFKQDVCEIGKRYCEARRH